jgi:anti-sigma28 factor (negative regulator of flagellin synthesis)
MKVDTINRHPHLAHTKKGTPFKKYHRGNASTISWIDQVVSARNQAVIKPRIPASQQRSENRAALVEHLRIQVSTGSYVVDSSTLAEHILKNGTHFFIEGEQE